MPYFNGPILIAYQLIVPGSCSASGCADFRKFSTSFSLPGLASSCAQMASFPINGFSSFPSDARCTDSVAQPMSDKRRTYNFPMSMIDQIQKDIVTAMKAREEQRLSTLRMVKTALKNREIEKMAPLDDKESQQVLSTLIKQRKESVEQFTKGGRQEMADKEAAEITLIET